MAKWLKTEKNCPDSLSLAWLPLPVLALKAQFTCAFRDFAADVVIVRDSMTVSGFGEENEFRSVEFYSHLEFAMYIKREISKRVS